MRREKGSITIFSLLAILLVTAAIFALLEGTRLQELRRFANLQTTAALEYAFAEYNTCLWQSYHLLATDERHLATLLEEAANGRQGSASNFLRFVPEAIDTRSYVRITDREGEVFIQSVSTYMKDNILYEAIKEIYSQYEAIKQVMDSSALNESDISDALEEIKKLEESATETSVGTSASKQGRSIDVRGLLEAAEQWKKMGILELMVKDTSKLSDAQIDLENGLLERELQEGTEEGNHTTNWVDRILLQQYLLTYMSNLQAEKKDHALSYELEYLLGKKGSDIENLKIVATELLAIRQASNFLYLLSNPVKLAQAESLATLIGGASLNAAVIQLIKVALLTAWALAESVLDVRALLAGKKIALLKSEESWTLELSNIGEITGDYMTAKESAWGINYETYLGLLLLLQNERNLAMHAMNAQEATIRNVYGDEGFCLDDLVTQVEVEISYTYEPIFPFLRVIDAEKRWNYEIQGKDTYSYY